MRFEYWSTIVKVSNQQNFSPAFIATAIEPILNCSHTPTISHSPPETPLELHSQMAVDNATPGKRDRLPDGPTKAQDQGNMSPVRSPGLKSPIKIEKPAQAHVQVPSTRPNPKQAGKSQETQPQEEVEAGADENEAQKPPEDPNSDLPEFDYNTVQIQYSAVIREASTAEDDLLNEFTAYTDVFRSFHLLSDHLLT
jgi:hypothetical protein